MIFRQTFPRWITSAWESSLHRMIFLRPQAVKLRVAVAFVFADDFLEGYVEV
jgi:hypothetical protein